MYSGMGEYDVQEAFMKITFLGMGLMLFLCFVSAGVPAYTEQQIGRMLIIGFRGTSIQDTSYITRVIRDLNIGGVVLYDYDVPSQSHPRNIIDSTQVALLTRGLKRLSPSLLIAVDAEGGQVNRLKPQYGFAEIPGHQKLGQLNDPDSTRAAAARLAEQLSGLGINTNFAPVVDVNRNPDNPIIAGKGRSFSDNPDTVVQHAGAFIRAHRRHGILTALKHFPGHGSSAGDTHIGLVDVTDTYSRIELQPFRELVQAGLADMIMTAHIMNRDIDPVYPVTVSRHYIQPLLREQYGFNGVVVSDDMQMGAMTGHFTFKESVIRAVNAGCDMLIISNNAGTYNEQAPYTAVQIIKHALNTGKIAPEQIKESLFRIHKLKTGLPPDTYLKMQRFRKALNHVRTGAQETIVSGVNVHALHLTIELCIFNFHMT
ncbi:MAG: glycoside hydrolase family 3 protein [candidate division KSB1 bacterium]|nr:glycoside hydrolase family 3 protein [candidate division KSB1 bacterium]